jgi:hypothetical protein
VFNCVVQCASSSSARFWPRDNYAQSFSITSTLYARNPELSWSRNRFDAVEVKTDIDGESETNRQGDFAFGKRKYSFQSRFVPRGFGDTVAENIRAWMVTPRREWRIPGVFLIYGELLDKVTIDWPETVDTLLTGIEYDDRTAITTMKLLEIV